MPLPAPNLDNRTFDDLVREARARIPRYTPEWTNFNDSDPGMTLVKLHAWLTETILFQLNRLPELTYIRFLDLLDIQPAPARAARADLTFRLKKLASAGDPLVTLIPKGTQVGVDDPQLEQPLLFETDRTLRALNAAIAAVIVPGPGGSRSLVSEYDAKGAESRFPHPFFPFGPSPAPGARCLLALLLRPHRREGPFALDRIPAGELELTVLVPEVFEQNARGGTNEGPESRQARFPWEVEQAAARLVWEAYTGTDHATQFTAGASAGWQPLPLNHDETAGLERGGHLFLELPGGLPPVRFDQLPRPFWASLSLQKPPTTAGELADDIESGILGPTELGAIAPALWDALGVAGSTRARLETLLGDPATNRAAIAALLRLLVLSFHAVDPSRWRDASPLYDAPPVEHGLTWLRARVREATWERAPEVSRIELNTVPATAAVTRIEELLGTSDGRPGQQFTLPAAPVLVDTGRTPPVAELEVELLEGDGRAERWQRVPDFFDRGPGEAVFLLDPARGLLTFGDGVHGRIPPAGTTVIARRYRVGGGQRGNAGPGTISALRSSVSEVESVTNLRAAAGGKDAEPLAEVLLRAPHELRATGRAVSADDFADLARQCPGVPVQRAYALPRTRLDRGSDPPAFLPQAGAVTVVLLPENRDETPQPSEAQLQLVAEHLDQRRLITTELYVTGPRYLRLERLAVELLVGPDADLKAVRDAAAAALLRYFHPLEGGEEARGWPFGQPIYEGGVYRQLLAVAGVRRVLCLDIRPTDPAARCDDLILLPPGTLPHLPRAALDIKVTYERPAR